MNPLLILCKRTFSIKLGVNYNLYNFTKRRKNLTKRSIFSIGDLLQAVQTAEVFPQEEDYLEKKLKYPVADVLDNFQTLKKEFGGTIPAAESMKSFIRDNFEDQASTEPWVPTDWLEEPLIFDRIWDDELKKWALNLNTMWKQLGKKVSKAVCDNPDLFATYCLPNGFITTERRNNSMFYWSSYWIINGLLVCGMFRTARGMIDNLTYLLDTVGHIPMGSQMYYEGRTGPPMLALILDLYLTYSGDFDYIQKNINFVIKELEYWDKERSTQVQHKGKVYKFYRYCRKIAGPRPENYRIDKDIASLGISNAEMLERYIAIQSAVESGWHFSSRWVNVRGDNKGNITDTHTQSIIPVDLNSIVHKSFVLLSEWYNILGEYRQKALYQTKAQVLLNSIESVLWNKKNGIWFDYDVFNNKPRNYFYLSNLAPLWTESYTFSRQQVLESTLIYLNRYLMDKYEGGLPASVEYSSEKWDFPNAWPPLQSYIIQGFDKLGLEDGTNVAFHFAQKWIRTVYNGFQKNGKLYEKYDSLLVGSPGDLENYVSLDGVGWTLGVVFQLLERWGPSLKPTDDSSS
ncbi:hypothetical protein O3M35_000516 [Rhynocoris fuscipes]|uniref:Trehalase n=1 Tax=Rhynocoris fuscipes TaxID=488301 RepID=A0AAW1DS20_9HEMI